MPNFKAVPDIPTKQNFKVHYVIGKGGFGQVWKVDYRKTNTAYAMKEMTKAK
jgi:serine/threonine protein kinase